MGLQGFPGPEGLIGPKGTKGEGGYNGPRGPKGDRVSSKTIMQFISGNVCFRGGWLSCYAVRL